VHSEGSAWVLGRHTFSQKDKDALSQNWDQAKGQLQSQFPGVEESDLESGRQNPEQLAQVIAQKTGQDQNQVEQSLLTVAQQYSQ